MYVREVTVRYRLRRTRKTTEPSGRVTGAADAVRLLVPLLGHEVVEVCGILCLSSRLEVLAYHECSRGTLDMTIVHPRDIFRTALVAHAASVVVAHNHPSGHVEPSAEDVALTQRLIAAGELLAIPLADHLIVSAEGRYFSFREAGQLN